MTISKPLYFIVILLGFLVSVGVRATGTLPDVRGDIVYVSPVPGAKYILPETNVILRFNRTVNRSIIFQPGLITVVGSMTGDHRGNLVMSDDDQTVIFKPEEVFQSGEEVTVKYFGGPTIEKGASIDSTSFTFSIAAPRSVTTQNIAQSLFGPYASVKGTMNPDNTIDPGSLNKKLILPDTVPPGFPHIETFNFGESAPGQIFVSNFKFINPPDPWYISILENSGSPIFYRGMASAIVDFKMQANRLLTYYDTDVSKYYALDSTYSIVDSFVCGNGYETDVHELQLLENGHSLLMSYDPQPVDMSQVVPGGDTNAVVTGLIIQELDSMKNVVFQWRSWDHFLITDAIGINLLDSMIDYSHGNAIELDTDGHLLISSRHMSEITKINRITGEIIWRLGGKNNQFTFVNDSLGFSYQHAIRRIENGNVTLYDNGNLHVPPFSRAVEYNLDENTKTATLVWQYRNTPDIFGFAMGNVQRLPNGNTLIGWGSTSPAVTEVRPDGSKVFELKYAPGVYTYRAFRFDWKPTLVNVPAEVPSLAFISQNYPNPFNGGTRISIGLTSESIVSLKIYDVLGREVMTVVENERRGVGTYQYDLDFTSLSSGVYIYRFLSDNISQVRKMIYIP